jgi:hypothetical protein
VIPPKTPNDVDEPAAVVICGEHSGVEAVAGAAAVPAAAVLAVPAVVVLGAPPENWAAVSELVGHPVDGDSSAPGGVASVKVGTLRGSQPIEIEDDTAEPGELVFMPLFACGDEDGFASDGEGAVGEVNVPAPAF